MTNREAYLFITTLMSLDATPGTKLEHAKLQTLKNARTFIEAYNDKLEDINIEYCSTDEKGNIIRDPRGLYVFTKDKQRALSKEVKKFLEADALIPFSIVATSDRKGLTTSQLEYLSEAGFIRDSLQIA